MSFITDTKPESFTLLLDVASSTTRTTLNINDEEPRRECRRETRQAYDDWQSNEDAKGLQ
jgi:hypothetical protein